MTIIVLNGPDATYHMLVPARHDRRVVRAFEAAANEGGTAALVGFSTDALLAQNTASVAQVSPKGAGTGAVPAPVAPPSGALQAPAPRRRDRGGPTRDERLERLARARESLKAMVAEKVGLMPANDAYVSRMRSARASLAALHEGQPLFGDPDLIKRRLAVHDRILAVSIEVGPQHRRYLEVSTLADALMRDVERLEAETAA